MENLLNSNNNYNYYSMMNLLESKSLSWIFIANHHDPLRSSLSWITFFLFAFAVPVLSHYHHNHLRPFDWIIQLSFSSLSAISFFHLFHYSRLRRFLFLHNQDYVNCCKLRTKYLQEVHVRIFLLH